jgi:hypothetical protein
LIAFGTQGRLQSLTFEPYQSAIPIDPGALGNQEKANLQQSQIL